MLALSRITSVERFAPLRLGLYEISQGLENLNILIILSKFFFCHLNGGHKFAVRACFEIELDIMLIKFSEFRSAQFGTNFLLTYYNTWCCRQRKRRYTTPLVPWWWDEPYQPEWAETYECRPPRIPSDFGPKNLFLLKKSLGVVLFTCHLYSRYKWNIYHKNNSN